MKKLEIAGALREAIERVGGMKPQEGFYEFLERVNRVILELEAEREKTVSAVYSLNGDPARTIEFIAADRADFEAVARAIVHHWERPRKAVFAAHLPYVPPGKPRVALGRWFTRLAARCLGVKIVPKQEAPVSP